jgi:hypothetical protein
MPFSTQRVRQVRGASCANLTGLMVVASGSMASVEGAVFFVRPCSLLCVNFDIVMSLVLGWERPRQRRDYRVRKYLIPAILPS